MDGRRAARSDIQGLRALAVLLVIAQHFWNVPEGGFVGVDVFFVISGFLISSIILRDIEEFGRLRFRRFYARRIRRIVPAAVLVSLVALPAVWLTWFSQQALQFTLDAPWSNLWVSNWHFAGVGTDYLAHSQNPSPFQHYWSLSVEEQFYTVWPVLLTCAWLLGRAQGRAQRTVTAAVIAIALLSFAWAVAFTAYRGQWAYFDTLSRGFEFALGALAARFALHGLRARVAGAAGLAGMLVSALAITPDLPFPGPWALLPAASAALVLAAREQGAVVGSLLGNRAMQWAGDVSYSLYLWHFPVLVIGTAWLGRSAAASLALLALTLLLAAASYRWVENPIRRSRWLRHWEERDAAAAGAAGLGASVRGPAAGGCLASEARGGAGSARGPLLASSALAALLVLLGGYQMAPWKTGVLAAQSSAVRPAHAGEPFGGLEPLQAALRAPEPRDWSGLTPAPGELNQKQVAPALAPGTPCAAAFGDTELGLCTWGDEKASRHILVIGDSVALAWTPAVVRASGPESRVTAAGVGTCSPFDIRQEADFDARSFPEKCAATREALLRLVEREKPDVTVLASAVGGFDHQLDEDGRLVTDSGAQKVGWELGTERVIRRISRYSGQVLVLGSPGLTQDPRVCMRRFGLPSDCTADLTSRQLDKEQAEAETVSRLRGEGIRVSRFDALSATCAEGRCPLVVGGILTHTDPTHITLAFAEAMAPVLDPYLRGSTV